MLRKRGGFDPKATPSTAFGPQRKVGFPIPTPALSGFQGTKTARREGISSPFSDAGVALRSRAQALSKRIVFANGVSRCITATVQGVSITYLCDLKEDICVTKQPRCLRISSDDAVQLGSLRGRLRTARTQHAFNTKQISDIASVAYATKEQMCRL